MKVIPGLVYRTTVCRTLLLVKPKGEKLLEWSSEASVPFRTPLKRGRVFCLSDVGSLWRASSHCPLCDVTREGLAEGQLVKP